MKQTHCNILLSLVVNNKYQLLLPFQIITRESKHLKMTEYAMEGRHHRRRHLPQLQQHARMASNNRCEPHQRGPKVKYSLELPKLAKQRGTTWHKEIYRTLSHVSNAY